jgi:hypothetical protein
MRPAISDGTEDPLLHEESPLSSPGTKAVISFHPLAKSTFRTLIPHYVTPDPESSLLEKSTTGLRLRKTGRVRLSVAKLVGYLPLVY